MFHRRHRSASASARPQSQAPLGSAAQSAAAQAFLASRPSSTNLSSSAAAAALRSMSPKPTPVDQVQTKRMLQRQSSNGSNGNGRPGMERQNSSGSMTERTFRSPSPNRPDSQPIHQNAPPVPPIPRTYRSPPPLATRSDQRSASMEPPPRVLSPTLRNPAGRGASLDRQGPTSPGQKTIAQRNSNLTDITELERSDSRNSTNFSYPLGARPNSPPPKQSPLMQSRWAPGQPQSGMSATEAEEARQGVSDSAQTPVKKKKKKVVRGAAEGSHLSSGTMGVRTSTAAPEPVPLPRVEPSVYASESQEIPVKKKKKKVTTTAATPEVQSHPMSPGYNSSSDAESSISTPDKTAKRTQRASGQLNKQPSVVREDWEGEQGGSPMTPANMQQVNGAGSAESPASTAQNKTFSNAANMSRKIDEAPIETLTETKPVAQFAPTLAVEVPSATLDLSSSATPQTDSKSHLGVGRSASQGARQSSLSPSRSKTRFSMQLASDLSAERKHEPLPRSVSPAKSAMKHHSPAPYGTSAVDNMVPGAWRGNNSRTPSETSETTSMASEQGLTSGSKKKKSVRVSFEEGAEVVGMSHPAETDSPVFPSPQNKEQGKKGWFGIGKSKSSPLGTIPAEDDMEEVMKPRPMLPSFGSVRGKRDGSEQRHSSATYDTVTAPSSSETSTASTVPTMDTSVSSDHAIGAILAQDRARHTPQSSMYAEKPGLPIPPEVTSVEGSGYHSDESASVYSHDEQSGQTVEETIPEHGTIESVPAAIERTTTDSTPATTEHTITEYAPSVMEHSTVESARPAEAMPTIAIQPATPALEREVDDMFVSLPGGFPVSAETLPATTSETTPPAQYISDPLLTRGSPSTSNNQTSQYISDRSLTGLGVAGSSPQEQDTPEKSTPVTAQSFAEGLRQREQDKNDEDSDDDSAIFSDAEEDLSYMDGDGFGSINAIVESPVMRSPANRITPSPDSPIARSGGSPMENPAFASRTASWDQAQAHWSEVAQRRRQEQEQAPLSESSPNIIEAQQTVSERQEPTLGLRPEVVQPPKPKTKKKKLNIQASEIAPQVAAGMTSPPLLPPQASSSRAVGPGSVSAKPMRKSMKAQAAPSDESSGPRPMRKSMKAESEFPTGPQFRSSMRPVDRMAVQPQSQRQMADSVPRPTKTKGALQKKHIPPASTGLSAADAADSAAYSPKKKSAMTKAAQPKPVIASVPQVAPFQQTFSNDSESDSSFRKRRKARGSSDGRYTMARSMRGLQPDVKGSQARTVPAPAGRGGGRSASPVSRRPFSSAGGQSTMRSSMRSSFDRSAPTLRTSGGQQRSSSALTGFGRGKPAKGAAVPPSSSKARSRFADSDDEDEPGSKVFSSRFEDSDSDEDSEPVKFRPVRGIPKKIDEGDSTDLEDSSDVEKEMAISKAPNAATSTATATAVKNGNENGIVKFADTPQTSSKEKKSFFGRFRSKRVRGENARVSQVAMGSTVQRQAYLQQARTEMDRTKIPEIERTKSPDQSQSVPPAALQRRATPQRVMSDSHVTSQRIPSESWPLPPKIGEEKDVGRPYTSDGFAASASPVVGGAESRPGAPERQNTASTVRSVGGTPIYSSRTGKKKKFPMLRRAFGLYD